MRGLFVGATLLLLANAAWAQGLIVSASGSLPVGFPGGDAGYGTGGRLGWELANGATPSLRLDYNHWNTGFRGTDFVAVVATLVGADYRVPLGASADYAELSVGGGADYALSRHFLVGGGLRLSAVLTDSEFGWIDFSAGLSAVW